MALRHVPIFIQLVAIHALVLLRTLSSRVAAIATMGFGGSIDPGEIHSPDPKKR